MIPNRYGALLLFAVLAFLVRPVGTVSAAPPLTDPVEWGAPADSVEVIEDRTQHAKRFDNGDGSFTTVLSIDLHYEDTPGVWRDVDHNWRAAGDVQVMDRNPRYRSEVNADGIDVTDAKTGKGIRWYAPRRPDTRGRTAHFDRGGLTWEYENVGDGVKVSATVRSPRGPQTYRFTYALLGGAAALRISGDGHAIGDGFTVPRSVAIGANGVIYDMGPWAIVPGPRLAMSFDDSGLPDAAYPYVLDPTTTLQPSAGIDTYIQAGAPTSNYDGVSTVSLGDNDGGGSNAVRMLLKFDVSSISSGDSVSAATLTLHANSGGDGAGLTPWNITVNRLLANWVEAEATWNNYKTGTAWPGSAGASTDGTDRVASASATTSVAQTGYPKDIDFTGLASDVDGFVGGSLNNYGWLIASESVENSGANIELNNLSLSEDATASYRPKLVVVSTPPTAAVTGTIGDGATEQEVRDGDGTIIITLTGTTWVAAGGTFNAQRQNIIDGLDSAQSETFGWNAEVRDQMGVSSVVRTSGTIATVTVAAADVADYRMDSNEIITVTVPASAISSAGAITASPTFYITAAGEGVTVSGTLGASGGTPAEIVAGEETVILTLANTKWVADGSTFNAQRQNIIDGMDSNLADQNGWDARRSDFAVTDVARTSDAVVTVTLSASAAYAIPAAETVTATVPASAIVYGVALVASPAFTITPSFVASGSRVSGAIDLSGVANVAFCSLGWKASTPANTTVSVETSVNGGSTYSDASNGSCPTGITLGTGLSAITDFRTRVSLTTGDTTVTPLVNALILVIQDTSGQALFYELNTIPGITIDDRSDNSNTGTMSYPTSQTSINSTTGVLESTRSAVSLEQLLAVGDIVSPVTGAAASGNIFNQTETGFGSLPFQAMMETMATGGELPLKFVWVVAIGLFSIALGVVALHLTGSLMISGIGLGAGLSVGAAIGGGLIPGWTVILFVILALALVVMRSRGALPL